MPGPATIFKLCNSTTVKKKIKGINKGPGNRYVALAVLIINIQKSMFLSLRGLRKKKHKRNKTKKQAYKEGFKKVSTFPK